MKTLLILRHGKAESYSEDGDKSRSLAERGHRDAKRMGALIREKVGTLNLVVSSDAVRARQTAVIAAKAAGYEKKIDYRPEIYEASVRVLLGVVRSLPESSATVLIVGHNPGFEELAADLVEEAVPGLPTTGLAIVNTDRQWSDIDVGTCTLAGTFAPKEL